MATQSSVLARRIPGTQEPGALPSTGSAGKESACNAGDPISIPGSGKSAGEGRLPTRVFLGFPCGSAGKESACNAGDLGSIPGLGKATHSSILAWRVPWTPSKVSQKVGTRLSDFHFITVRGILRCYAAVLKQKHTKTHPDPGHSYSSPSLKNAFADFIFVDTDYICKMASDFASMAPTAERKHSWPRNSGRSASLVHARDLPSGAR